MNTVTILVGLPCTGKSTFVDEHHKESYVISFDRDITALGGAYGETDYHQCFVKFSPIIREGLLLDTLLKESLKHRSVVVDKTNLTVKGRKKLIDFYTENGYHISCRVFNPRDKHEELIKSRDKYVSQETIARFSETLEWPTLDEGFESIRFHTYH